MLKKIECIPPRPVWKCRDCHLELYRATSTNPDGIKPWADAPNKCPRCKSTNVVNHHVVILSDPPTLEDDDE